MHAVLLVFQPNPGKYTITFLKFLGMTLLLVSILACGKGKKPYVLKSNEKITDYVAVTTIGNLNMRINPHQETARINVLADGMVLEVLDRSEEKVRIAKNEDYWYQLRTKDGLTGWVYGAYLILVKKENQAKAAEIAVEQIRQEKLALLKNLAGYWTMTTREGNDSHHKVRIFEDGSYLAYSEHIKQAYVGDIEIFLKGRKLTFKAGTTFGRDLYYRYSQQSGYSIVRILRGSQNEFVRQDKKAFSVRQLKGKGYKIYR